MAGALPNGGMLAVQDPFKQQKSNWFRRHMEGGEVVMLNKIRMRIYSLSEDLGKKADGLVLRRKTSFIALCAKAFMGKELEMDPRRAKVERFLSEATTMEQTYNTVTITRTNGDRETMNMAAYMKLKKSEEEKMQIEHRTRNTSSLDTFLNTSTGKKRKKA